MLGATAADMDELDIAVSNFQAACQLHPSDATNWDALAMAYRRLGERRLAAEALQQAVAGGVADADIHYKLGMELAWLGDLAEADKHARQAATLAPDDQRYAYQGELQKWLDDARANEEKAREFLRANPQAREDPSALRDPDLLLLAVHHLSVLRERAKADRALACLRERFPNSPEAALGQALVLATFRNSEADLRQAVEQLEGIAASAGLSEHWQMIVSTQLSHHYYLLGEVERARQIVEAWLRKHPRDEGMWVFLRQICEVLERPEDCAALRKALGLDRMPDTGSVIFKLGVVPLLALTPLILIPVQLMVRIVLVLGAVGAMAYFFPGWVQGPSCTLRNERGAVTAAVVAGVGALLISGGVLVHSALFCCLDPLLWAAFAAAPALYYIFSKD